MLCDSPKTFQLSALLKKERENLSGRVNQLKILSLQARKSIDRILTFENLFERCKLWYCKTDRLIWGSFSTRALISSIMSFRRRFTINNY